jgi:hypothetical protein
LKIRLKIRKGVGAEERVPNNLVTRRPGAEIHFDFKNRRLSGSGTSRFQSHLSRTLSSQDIGAEDLEADWLL